LTTIGDHVTTFSGLSQEKLAADAVQLAACRLHEVTLLRAARRVEEVLGVSARPPDST
jgi:hypothetical protein